MDRKNGNLFGEYMEIHHLFHKTMMKDFKEGHSGALPGKTACRVLFTIKKHPGMPMKGLAERTGLEKGPFSQLAEKLEKDNLVSRKNHPEDRRIVNLELTEKGEKTVREIISHLDRHANKKMEVLSADEKKDFHTAMEILKKTAEKIS